MRATNDQLLNSFAIRSFRDVADGDYIAARMACRAQLHFQYLWSSQQAIEKYVKCILLLHRIPAKEIKHDLSAGLAAIESSGKLKLNLVRPTEEFIAYIDRYGQSRYFEISNHANGHDLVRLDRSVWELRRFCTLDHSPRALVLRDRMAIPKVRLAGQLEAIIDNAKHPAREPLLWQNGFFGRRSRKKVALPEWKVASNAPLYLDPHLLDEVLKYVHLPKSLISAYRSHQKKGPEF
ncbi:MAG: hypothetical protein JNM66_12780 [Bryobacterales bacterium]|nr:hypothetical protein [Bryobacterales bacterium]